MNRIVPGAVLVVVAATFAPALGFALVNWDDPLHITSNPAVVGDATWRERLLTPTLGYPIPVTVASYAIEHAMFGGEPRAHHATNLLLHLIACMLVFRLGSRLGLGPAGASAAMLCFGVHPLVAEPVSWVSGRKDLLATVLALGCVLYSERWLRNGHLLDRVLAAIAFGLAVFSKPSTLCLAFAPALLHRHMRGAGWWEALRSARPEFVTAAFGFALALVGQWKSGAVATSLSALAHLRSVWYALGYHLGLVAFLQPTQVKHIPSAWPPAFDPLVDLLPVAWAALALVAHRRGTIPRTFAVRFGLAWAGFAYLPNSNIVPLTRFLADSYLYLPLVGFAWIAGALIDALARRITRGLTAALLVTMAIALAVPAARASSRWRDSVTLWRSAYAIYPTSPQVCRELGNAYAEAGDLREALAHYDVCAHRFGPERFDKNAAVVLFALGQHAEAAAIFERLAITLPDDPVVQKYLRLLGRDAPTSP